MNRTNLIKEQQLLLDRCNWINQQTLKPNLQKFMKKAKDLSHVENRDDFQKALNDVYQEEQGDENIL